jgi:hypothetical protein
MAVQCILSTSVLDSIDRRDDDDDDDYHSGERDFCQYHALFLTFFIIFLYRIELNI